MKPHSLRTFLALFSAAALLAPHVCAEEKDKEKAHPTPGTSEPLGQQREAEVVAPAPAPSAPVDSAQQAQLRVHAAAAADRAAFLKIHNDARAAKRVEPLLWNAACAAAAQDWAQRLANKDTGLVHSQRPGFGENIWRGSGRNFTPASAAHAWLSEIRQYHGETIDQSNYRKFGHYTQMVWSRTTGVGYGVARAASGNLYIVANYSPAGNFIGQKPYK